MPLSLGGGGGGGVCCVLEPLNSFFHSGMNFLMRPVGLYDSRNASFSASVFFLFLVELIMC